MQPSRLVVRWWMGMVIPFTQQTIGGEVGEEQVKGKIHLHFIRESRYERVRQWMTAESCSLGHRPPVQQPTTCRNGDVCACEGGLLGQLHDVNITTRLLQSTATR